MLSILRTPSQLVDCLDSVQDPMQQSVTLKILSLSSCRILASGLLLNLSELVFQVGFDVGNWAILVVDVESSRPNFHTPVPCRQTSTNSARAQSGRKWKTKF